MERRCESFSWEGQIVVGMAGLPDVALGADAMPSIRDGEDAVMSTTLPAAALGADTIPSIEDDDVVVGLTNSCASA